MAASSRHTRGRAWPPGVLAALALAAAPAAGRASRPWAQTSTRSAPSVGRGPADVTCHGPRISLACVVPELPEPWSEVDLGAAAAPLQQRRITAGEIDQRVRRARLAPVPMPLPAVLRVERAGQEVAAAALTEMVRAAVEAALPDGAVVRALSVAGGVALGEGALSVRLDPPVWRDGRQTLMARPQSADGVRLQVPVMLDLDHPDAQPPVAIARGQEVTVRVVVGNVQVQRTGVAQEAGALGEAIAVLPEAGGRVLRGRIVDGHTVEVRG